MKKKLSPFEQAALKYGVRCVTLRKGGKETTHCAPFNRSRLLDKLKGSIIEGRVTPQGFKFVPRGHEILHLTEEPKKKPSRKKPSKRA